MSGFNAFFKQYKTEAANVQFAASQSFLDENGTPLEWVLKPLKAKEADDIRSQCTEMLKGGKVKLDTSKFNRMVAAKCTVYPNLNDAELQNSYGVMGAENLIIEMLDNAGEYQNYVQKCLEISGYGKNDTELVDEAKN